MGPLASAAGLAQVPGGWAPVDRTGVHRHAALGLFDSTADLVSIQAAATKSPHSPLFGQDRPWETRIDNGYPNVVYDPDAAGDGPWRLWYGDIGSDGVGQYLLYANSSDGIIWSKPDLNRYDLHARWAHDPEVAKLGKHNNIVMFGGGLGVYRDLHDKNASLRYKISGGAPAGCYDQGGDTGCLVGTAGSPDGISNWSDVVPLGFPAPWRPDCHTNLFWDEPLSMYIMTTRSVVSPDGRLISIARTGGGGRTVFEKNGSWTALYHDLYPPTSSAESCFKLPKGYRDSADFCAEACFKTPSCLYFWT